MKDFSVSFYLSDSGYITALRLVAGAVCSAHDIDVEATEDFKVCVTESVIMLKNCGYERVNVVFGGESAECSVTGEGGTPAESENDFSLALISALVEDCKIEKRGGITERVILKI